MEPGTGKGRKVIFVTILFLVIFILFYLFSPYFQFIHGSNIPLNDLVGGLFVADDSSFNFVLTDSSSSEITYLENSDVITKKYPFELKSGVLTIKAESDFVFIVLDVNSVFSSTLNSYLWRYENA